MMASDQIVEANEMNFDYGKKGNYYHFNILI